MLKGLIEKKPGSRSKPLQATALLRGFVLQFCLVLSPRPFFGRVATRLVLGEETHGKDGRTWPILPVSRAGPLRCTLGCFRTRPLTQRGSNSGNRVSREVGVRRPRCSVFPRLFQFSGFRRRPWPWPRLTLGGTVEHTGPEVGAGQSLRFPLR